MTMSSLTSFLSYNKKKYIILTDSNTLTIKTTSKCARESADGHTLNWYSRTCSDMKFELHSFAPLSTCDDNPDMYIGLQFVCCPAGKFLADPFKTRFTNTSLSMMTSLRNIFRWWKWVKRWRLSIRWGINNFSL